MKNIKYSIEQRWISNKYTLTLYISVCATTYEVHNKFDQMQWEKNNNLFKSLNSFARINSSISYMEWIRIIILHRMSDAVSFHVRGSELRIQIHIQRDISHSTVATSQISKSYCQPKGTPLGCIGNQMHIARKSNDENDSRMCSQSISIQTFFLERCAVFPLVLIHGKMFALNWC